MSTSSSIEWTDTTWNPVVGCKMVSAGCTHCYAETMAVRQAGMAKADVKAGRKPGRKAHYAKVIKNGGWNGHVVQVPESLSDPFRWRAPRKVFVNSMSDLFHEDVPFDYVDKVFAVMALTPQHTYQILTKRPERMAEYLNDFRKPHLGVWNAAWNYANWSPGDTKGGIEAIGRHSSADHVEEWPLPNVWLGTSVENQQSADERIPHLLKCPAAARFLSCEPLLGPVDLAASLALAAKSTIPSQWRTAWRGFIDWVIVGGESGPGARPMHPAWVRSIRDQCVPAGASFFFKQWGHHLPWDSRHSTSEQAAELQSSGRIKLHQRLMPDGTFPGDRLMNAEERDDYMARGVHMVKVGKSAAGRLLDGRTWDQMPSVSSQAALAGGGTK